MSKHLLASKHGDSEMFTSAFTSVHYVGYVTAMWTLRRKRWPGLPSKYSLSTSSKLKSCTLSKAIAAILYGPGIPNFQKILRSSLYLPKGCILWNDIHNQNSNFKWPSITLRTSTCQIRYLHHIWRTSVAKRYPFCGFMLTRDHEISKE